MDSSAIHRRTGKRKLTVCPRAGGQSLSLSAQVQVQVHVPLDAGHLTGVGVLPQVKVVVEIRFGVVLRQPQGIPGQLPLKP